VTTYRPKFTALLPALLNSSSKLPRLTAWVSKQVLGRLTTTHADRLPDHNPSFIQSHLYFTKFQLHLTLRLILLTSLSPYSPLFALKPTVPHIPRQNEAAAGATDTNDGTSASRSMVTYGAQSTYTLTEALVERPWRRPPFW
jgi:hypothetical protein